MLAFSDLRTAAYCPRQLWYARQRDNRSPPERVHAVRDLATRYDDALADPESIDADLLAVPVETWRERLRGVREREPRFPDLCDPVDTDVFLSGRECHGVASKVLPDPPLPSLVSPGKPPEQGVWEPHAVWAVAAAKALSWERETRVDEVIVEYPAYGVVRRVRLTTRKKARYREAIRTVRDLGAPPARLDGDAASKCEPCEYAEECGVRTSTLRSLLAGD
ncbi:CRISPR-associated protein Cas4 [Halorubellus salinus]|uniref:CRISPR-associated protein Cas4 n=1 Tax=Halorubellus salinus TaxID=755309 RepID=UPI001D063BB8